MSGDLAIPTFLDARSLPAIITRASTRLLGAKNSAEVLEAKHIAEAALHYAKVTQAANETHADCLRIITRAEMRMANELDKKPSAQGRNLPNVHTVDERASYDDLGIDRRRAAEWRAMRDAGEENVERVIKKALDEGRAPTKREILNEARGDHAEPDNEDDVEPENYRTAFLIRVDTALEMAAGLSRLSASAPYSKSVAKDLVAKARQVADAWVNLSQQMEKRL